MGRVRGRVRVGLGLGCSSTERITPTPKLTERMSPPKCQKSPPVCIGAVVLLNRLSARTKSSRVALYEAEVAAGTSSAKAT